MSQPIVKAVEITATNAGEDWACAHCGGGWWVVTSHLHASDIPPALNDPKLCAELVARLINEWDAKGRP